MLTCISLPFRTPSHPHPPPSRPAPQHFEEIFERSLTVKGFICGTGEVAKALPGFYDAVTPLVQAGKITSREHRFEGLREAGAALASVHEGSNVGKAVIVVAEA